MSDEEIKMSEDLKNLCFEFTKAYHHKKSDDKDKDKRCFRYDYSILVRLVEQIVKETK